MRSARFVTTSGIIESYPDYVEILPRSNSRRRKQPLYLHGPLLSTLLEYQSVVRAFLTEREELQHDTLVFFLANDEVGAEAGAIGKNAFILRNIGSQQCYIGYGSDHRRRGWGIHRNRIPFDSDLVAREVMNAVIRSVVSGIGFCPTGIGWYLSGRDDQGREYLVSPCAMMVTGSGDGPGHIFTREKGPMWRDIFMACGDLFEMKPGSCLLEEDVGLTDSVNLILLEEEMVQIEFLNDPDNLQLQMSGYMMVTVDTLMRTLWPTTEDEIVEVLTNTEDEDYDEDD